MNIVPLELYEVKVGNIYRARAGRPRKKGHCYLVVSIHDHTCICLIIDIYGRIVGATQYARYYLAEKEPLKNEFYSDIRKDLKSFWTKVRKEMPNVDLG